MQKIGEKSNVKILRKQQRVDRDEFIVPSKRASGSKHDSAFQPNSLTRPLNWIILLSCFPFYVVSFLF